MPFGVQLGQKIHPKSKKIRLQSVFGKRYKKYHASGGKVMLPKSKNIAKTMEGCSKSHFSHVRNKVGKSTLRPLILERFLDPKSSQDRQKVVSKSLQKTRRLFITILLDFEDILDPTGDPKNLYFSSFLWLAAALGSSGRQEGVQGSSRSRFFKNLGAFWDRYWRNFQRFSTSLAPQ